MDRHTHDRETTRGTAARGTGNTEEFRLRHLSELDDYKVADGEPDIRGWDVRSTDGRKIGEVEDLIVDFEAMKVRYVEVELDKKELELPNDRHILVPIGTARLDDDHDNVLVNRPSTELAGMPAYSRGTMSRDHELELHNRYARTGLAASPGRTDRNTENLYEGEHFDDRRFFGKRRRDRDDAAYITRSEEELAVGKRRAQMGSVEVHKTVETEHVREKVPVRREEAEIERRPVSADAARRGNVEIGEDEVRVPLMGEEVVAEKRAIPKEEVVIRKKAVEDTKTVEADLRRERIDVNKSGERAHNDRR